jgi:hypothetical protein
MLTISAKISISNTHTLNLVLPNGVLPGEYDIVLVLDKSKVSKKTKQSGKTAEITAMRSFTAQSDAFGFWNDAAEDIYQDFLP